MIVLTIYLPGNGGVLNAVAMMCTGTDADKSNINNRFSQRLESKMGRTETDVLNTGCLRDR
jgi:hypothetical protein